MSELNIGIWQKRIICFVLMHDWEYSKPASKKLRMGFMYRKCRRCGREEIVKRSF